MCEREGNGGGGARNRMGVSVQKQKECTEKDGEPPTTTLASQSIKTLPEPRLPSPGHHRANGIVRGATVTA